MDPLEGVVPMRLRDADPSVNRTTGIIIDAALEVQKDLGTGLLEKAYELALAHELSLRGLQVLRQVPLDIRYKDLAVPSAYFLDLLVEKSVVVELKAAEGLDPRHLAQLATYLRFGGYRIGLLINFHAYPLKSGIHRVVL